MLVAPVECAVVTKLPIACRARLERLAAITAFPLLDASMPLHSLERPQPFQLLVSRLSAKSFLRSLARFLHSLAGKAANTRFLQRIPGFEADRPVAYSALGVRQYHFSRVIDCLRWLTRDPWIDGVFGVSFRVMDLRRSAQLVYCADS